jgi:uncharacterized repeat protein (TIGR01451 family)
LALAGVQAAHAAGTASGTDIANTVTVDYQVGSVSQTQLSASATFKVDDKVLLTVAGPGSATSVVPNATSRVLQYSLTNTGNTTHGYTLTTTLSGTFTPTNIRIYKDNGDNTFNAGTDTLYVASTNVGDLAADATMTLFVVSDIPAGSTNGQSAVVNLIATTTNAGTATATSETAGADTAGTVDIVFADTAGTADSARDGKHSAAGTYSVSSASLAATKTSAVISDPFNGGTNPKRIPGATVRYTITLTNSGAQAATTVVITDAIPANTTYTAGTITLNGVAKTDAVGGPDDEASFGSNTVTVNVASVAAGGGTATVTFDVTIN